MHDLVSDTAPIPVLGGLGERRIFTEILQPSYQGVLAFGDDCAVVGDQTVITTDSCPAPLLDQLTRPDPYAAGWLLATINLSDLAAAGATPTGLVVNYTLPVQTRVTELRDIIAGVNDCAREHGTKVVGGDIRDGRERHLSATAIGRTSRHRNLRGRWTDDRLSRRGAAPGDVLMLVGHPGNLWGAALVHRGHAVVDDTVSGPVFERARQPMAQVLAGRLLAGKRLATAAIDVSDGLFAAVRILADTNGVGAELDEDVQLSDPLMQICAASGVSPFQLAQNWGDWCLLVAVRSRSALAAESLLRNNHLEVRRIGTLTADQGVLTSRPRDGAPRQWRGVDQERFTTRSWQGDGIDAHIAWMLRHS